MMNTTRRVAVVKAGVSVLTSRISGTIRPTIHDLSKTLLAR